MKTVVVDTPVEECDMEPREVCHHVTRLIPQLKPSRECVQVPKEVCSTSRVNPRTVQVPYIQNWCFLPEELPGLPGTTTEASSTRNQPAWVEAK